MENLTQEEMQFILGGTGSRLNPNNELLVTPPFGNDEQEE